MYTISNIQIRSDNLLLHGGDHADSTRYAKIQTIFAEHGIASLAFDFRGCGHSEGEFADSTLEHRLSDAAVVLQEFSTRTQLSDSQIYLWGSSMGAHITCRLLVIHPNIKGIILQSAATYSQRAEAVLLGNHFTHIIQLPDSWRDGLAFPAYAKYLGKKLVIYGQNDEVIPADILKEYQRLTPPAHYHLLKGGVHSMLRPTIPVQQGVWDTMVKLALDFILET
jgi:hypothetical protein